MDSYSQELKQEQETPMRDKKYIDLLESSHNNLKTIINNSHKKITTSSQIKKLNRLFLNQSDEIAGLRKSEKRLNLYDYSIDSISN